jgi:hypothetical protein
MRAQLATLGMGRLSANRNAMADDVDDYGESQRAATARAKASQREASAAMPSNVERVVWSQSAADEPIETNTWNPIDDRTGGDMDFDSIPVDALSSAAADAAPSVLSFFNGKPYAEGVKAYRDHLVSRGTR